MSLVTISTGYVGEYHGAATPAYARLYADQQFTTSEGETIEAGSMARPDFYQQFTASLVGLQFATMTGTALTFQGSTDGTTYVAIKDSAGSSVSYTIASNTYTVIQPAVLAGVRYIKIVSGSAEGAARTITGVIRAWQ